MNYKNIPGQIIQIDSDEQFQLFPLPLSRRDQLARMAMQGLLAGNFYSKDTKLVAEVACDHADALIAELDKDHKGAMCAIQETE